MRFACGGRDGFLQTYTATKLFGCSFDEKPNKGLQNSMARALGCCDSLNQGRKDSPPPLPVGTPATNPPKRPHRFAAALEVCRAPGGESPHCPGERAAAAREKHRRWSTIPPV